MKHFLLLLRLGNDVQQKGWYASKTIIFNILTLLALVAARYGFELSSDDLMVIAAGVASIGNIVLRFATSTPVGANTIPVQAAPETPLPGDEKPFGDA